MNGNYYKIILKVVNVVIFRLFFENNPTISEDGSITGIIIDVKERIYILWKPGSGAVAVYRRRLSIQGQRRYILVPGSESVYRPYSIRTVVGAD